MGKFFRNLLLGAFAGTAFLFAASFPNEARADDDDYWNNYWGWYDRDYSPYYYQRHSNYGPYQGMHRAPYYGYYHDDPPYYGGRYYGTPGFGYRDYRGGGGLQAGPLRFRWR